MRRMAQAQGVFNVVGGLWPLVSMRTFEAVYGPKTDRWLVQTVGGLLTAIGATQLISRDPAQLRSTSSMCRRAGSAGCTCRTRRARSPGWPAGPGRHPGDETARTRPTPG